MEVPGTLVLCVAKQKKQAGQCAEHSVCRRESIGNHEIKRGIGKHVRECADINKRDAQDTGCQAVCKAADEFVKQDAHQRRAHQSGRIQDAGMHAKN